MTSHLAKPNTALWITRVKRGMSRKRIAALLGLRSTSLIYRWERGRSLPSLENALLLAGVLSMPIEFLFAELRNELLRALSARRDAGIEPGAVAKRAETREAEAPADGSRRSESVATARR